MDDEYMDDVYMDDVYFVFLPEGSTTIEQKVNLKLPMCPASLRFNSVRFAPLRKRTRCAIWAV